MPLYISRYIGNKVYGRDLTQAFHLQESVETPREETSQLHRRLRQLTVDAEEQWGGAGHGGNGHSLGLRPAHVSCGPAVADDATLRARGDERHGGVDVRAPNRCRQSPHTSGRREVTGMPQPLTPFENYHCQEWIIYRRGASYTPCIREPRKAWVVEGGGCILDIHTRK